VFTVTQSGPGTALASTTGATGGVASSASTSNPAKFASIATNSATSPGAGGGLQANAAGGGTAISATGNLNLTGACVGGCQGRPGFATKAQATQITARDTAGSVGNYASATVGGDGLALISYYDRGNGNLKVLHCSNLACTASTSSIPDSTGDVGLYTSIMAGTDGFGLISYYDFTNKDLKVAHCSNASCSAATLATLDSTGDVGAFGSIAIGTDGFGLVSYQDNTNKNLKAAHCLNTACSTAEIATLDADPGDVGSYTSIAIGVDGLGLITYYHPADNWGLAAAHCDSVACSSASVGPVDAYLGPDVGLYSSVNIGVDGLPMISYYDSADGSLGVVHCDWLDCSLGPITVLDGVLDDVGRYTSITTGADGQGLITYYDVTNGDLRAFHCQNATCTIPDLAYPPGPSVVDAAGDVGQYTAVTIGSDGLPLIAYYDVTHQDLKVAHCSNPWCLPYVRRR
jgi:hypothetical protein